VLSGLGPSTIQASIWAGNVVDMQAFDTTGSALALSPLTTVPDSGPRHVNFTLHASGGGSLLLPPGNYTARLEHYGDAYFTIPITENCEGMVGPLTGFTSNGCL
jgi:hypothetical protein